MKTLKLLGIAALSALLVFGVVACGDPEPKLLEGNDLSVTSLYGPYVGKLITAKWNGDPEDVTFEWTLGADVKTTEEEVTSTYTPAAPGTLTLLVKAEGYDPLEVTILIEKAPTHIEYIGTWKMDHTLAENKAWFDDKTNGGAFSETVVITKDHYRLQSDKTSAKAGVTPDPNEFFYMVITPEPTVKTGGTSLTGVTGFETGGVTLKGNLDPDAATGQHGGYSLPAGGFNLHLNAAKDKHVSDRNTIVRYYVRQQIPISLK